MISPVPRVSYAELARLFLRLSLSAFGGPVAHLALVEDEIVARRRWITRQHFLDLVAATNLIPGPNSTEVMIHIGYVLRGIPGALLTGACFIGPAFLLTLALAVLYVSTGAIPQIESILWGIKPVIVAIIAHVGYRLALTALRNRALWLLFALCLALLLQPWLGIPEVLIMIGAGLVYALYRAGLPRASFAVLTFPILPPAALSSLPLLTVATSASVMDLFWYFFKIGSILFGTGYILIAYIQQDVVNGFGWVTGRQLLDAVAIGQTTPGPLLTTVTVVGYIVAGFPGALATTLGVFLPSFVLVILTAPLIPHMRRSRFLGAFLSGINAGVIGAILVTLLDLASAALRTADGTAWSPLAIAVSLVSLTLLLRTRLNVTWLIGLGALIGLTIALLSA